MRMLCELDCVQIAVCEYRTGGSAKAKLAMHVRSLTNLAVGTDRPCMQRMAIALQIA